MDAWLCAVHQADESFPKIARDDFCRESKQRALTTPSAPVVYVYKRYQELSDKSSAHIHSLTAPAPDSDWRKGRGVSQSPPNEFHEQRNKNPFNEDCFHISTRCGSRFVAGLRRTMETDSYRLSRRVPQWSRHRSRIQTIDALLGNYRRLACNVKCNILYGQPAPKCYRLA